MISEHLTFFFGKKVIDYNPASPIDTSTNAYRIRVEFEDENTVSALLEKFADDPKASAVEELIIGAFDYEGGNSADIVSTLVSLSSKFSRLRRLFLGDITYEEQEISWINQCDVSPLLKAYPQLEYFRVRGANDLSFGKLKHANLNTLIIESGGLPPDVIREVSEGELPALEHLELWLGSESYGFDSEGDDFASILEGKNFPKLKYLGLRDSEIADELAQLLKTAPIVGRLETLDLSMGILSDVGGEALLNTPAVRNLKMLDLHYHFMSLEMMTRLRGLGISLNLDDPQEGDDGDRFIAVAE